MDGTTWMKEHHTSLMIQKDKDKQKYNMEQNLHGFSNIVRKYPQ